MDRRTGVPPVYRQLDRRPASLFGIQIHQTGITSVCLSTAATIPPSRDGPPGGTGSKLISKHALSGIGVSPVRWAVALKSANCVKILQKKLSWHVEPETGETPVPLRQQSTPGPVSTLPFRLRKFLALAGLTLLLVGHGSAQTSTTFVVGAFNIENWNSIERQGKLNQPKPQAEKDAVLNVIASVHPDVLGLEEIGTSDDLAELRAGLTSKGVVYPFVEYLQGADRDRRVCLLSRFPIVERHSRTDYTYRLNDQVTPIGRGILDVVVRVNDHYSFRAIVVHLKSKRTIEFGDQAVMRLEEAKLLRAHLNGIFKSNPATKLLALGDFNDTPETLPVKTVIGEPPFALFALPCQTGKGYTGTHLWRFHSDWSRLDYLLASPNLSNDFVTGSAHIYEGPAAGVASDHRLIYAGFTAPAVVIAPVATNPIRRLIFTGSLMGVVMVAGVVAIVVARHRLLDPES